MHVLFGQFNPTGKEEVVSWCFTPSQPVRIYQGEEEEEEKEEEEEEKEDESNTKLLAALK